MAELVEAGIVAGAHEEKDRQDNDGEVGAAL
jgi:hypothetical protein